jgi:hypothetical protein
MFTFLTAGAWCEESCFDTTTTDGAWFGSCGTLRFKLDGTFLWTVESDYTEVLADGPWDLTLESMTSGRVRVGGASEYLFERRGEELWLAGRRLRRCRGEAPPSPPGSVAILRPVPRPALLDTLCAHDWIKEDDFNLYSWPLELHFDRDLRFVARFRDTACRESGRFSVLGGRTPFGEASLVYQLQTPECGDMRGGPGSLGSSVAFVGSAMALDGVRYVPLGSPRARRHSPALCGNGSLCIDLSYDGEIRYRQATVLHLRFWNNAGRPVQLHSLRVTFRPLKVEKGSLGGSEQVYPVAERTYAGRTLAKDGSFSDDIRLVPPVRGAVVGLTLEWDYEDASGVHHCSEWPVLRIR